ncbi:unnamed protein product [Polarella glacialis]|uniref:Reverse transcriptase domain-containing protein n=1 Tax=Polarella glacialis TaxID=89957 RepID=A0A813KQQ8_POLGL|nr:unnamed protein product [Polarella glacialis]
MLSGRRRRTHRVPVRNDAGRLVIDAKATQTAWLQHGIRVYGGSELLKSELQATVEPIADHRPVLPTAGEIAYRAQSFKTGKTTKPGGPSGDVLKVNIEALTDILLQDLFAAMAGETSHTACIPAEAKMPLMFWLWKQKGSANDRDQYRGLGIRHHLFQLFIGVFTNRLKAAQSQALSYWHYGYRRGLSRLHAMFSMRFVQWRLTNSKKSWGQILFDQRIFFDLVDRDLLAEDYVAVGLSDGDAAVLRATIDSTSYEYPCSQEGATSKYQRTVKGVPQGGKESAILSLFPMQRIMSRAKQLRREARAAQGLTHTSLEVLSLPSNDVPRFPLVHADLPADCESWDVEDAAYADDVATLVQDPDANIPLVASTFCQALLDNKQEPNLDKSENSTPIQRCRQ